MARSPLARMPLVQSLAGYTAKDLGADVVAGLLITATAIPLGVGFAVTAGLPPITGLYTSMLPLIIFGLFSSTRHVKIGFDAAAAAMIGSAIVPLATVAGVVDQQRLGSLVAVLALLTGAMLILAGALRVGFLADLLSMPLLLGYQAGIALSVIIGQLPRMLGYGVTGDSDVAKAVAIVRGLGESHGPTIAIGVACLALLAAGRRWAPEVPGALVALVVFTAGSWAFDWSERGIATIGALPSGLPRIAVPDPGVIGDDVGVVLGTAASLALVLASDTVIPSRAFAARGRYPVSANVDIGALGLAQVASACTGGVTASASYARSAICVRVGSRTQLSAIFGGLACAVLVATMTGVLALIPLAVLGAICVDACLRLIETRSFGRLWRLRRTECAIAVATAAIVLITDPLIAIGVAVGASILQVLVRTFRPAGSRLGQRDHFAGWYAISDHPDAVPADPAVVVYRWSGPLVFANAGRFRSRALAQCTDGVRTLVIDCGAVFDLDPTAVEMLTDLRRRLAERGISPVFAGPAPTIARTLRAAGLAEGEAGPYLFADVDTAVAVARHPDGLDLRDPDGDGVYELRLHDET